MDRLSNDDLKWLLELLTQESLLEIEIASGDIEVGVKAAGAGQYVAASPVAAYMPAVGADTPAAAMGSATAPDLESHERLLAPMAGIFYRASSPDSPAFVDPGDGVEAGDTIGLIEAMKLYNEVTTHLRGRIVRFLVDDAQHVEADQPLVLIERFSM